MEAAKALGGSFKSVMLTPKTVRGRLNCPGKHKRMGTHKHVKETQMNTQKRYLFHKQAVTDQDNDAHVYNSIMEQKGRFPEVQTPIVLDTLSDVENKILNIIQNTGNKNITIQQQHNKT